MRSLIALLLTLVSAPLLAQDTPLQVNRFEAQFETFDVRDLGRFKYQVLFEVIGSEGQSMDAFAAQVSPLLRAWSDSTGFEACGVIATNGKRHGIRVGSVHSHIGCLNSPELVPDGMTSTDITIHSHGTDQKFQVSAIDIKLMGDTYAGGSYGKQTRRHFQNMSGQDLDEFSQADFLGGAGYLAGANGVLMFQDGTSNTRRVK